MNKRLLRKSDRLSLKYFVKKLKYIIFTFQYFLDDGMHRIVKIINGISVRFDLHEKMNENEENMYFIDLVVFVPFPFRWYNPLPSLRESSTDHLV